MKHKKFAPVFLGLVLIPFAGKSADIREGLASCWPLSGLATHFASTPDLAVEIIY